MAACDPMYGPAASPVGQPVHPIGAHHSIATLIVKSLFSER